VPRLNHLIGNKFNKGDEPYVCLKDVMNSHKTTEVRELLNTKDICFQVQQRQNEFVLYLKQVIEVT